MAKKFIVLLASLAFVAACAKKADDVKPINNQPAASGPQAQGKSPNATQPGTKAPNAPAIKAPPGPKVTNVQPGADDGKKVPVPSQAPGQPAVCEQPGKPAEAPVAEIVKTENKYTGAADDYAAPYLKVDLENEKNPVKKSANLKIARQIVDASLKRTSPCDLEMNLAIELAAKKHGKVVTNVLLTGASNERGQATLSGRSGGANPIRVSAELKCMDKNPNRDCGTMAAILTVDQKGHKSVAKILFRSSAAHFKIQFPTEKIMDQDYVDLVNLFRNTEFSRNVANSLQILKMDSVEVMNGISKMEITMVSHLNEIILFKMPLVKQVDDQMLVEVDKSIGVEEAIAITAGNPFKTRLADSITAVDMVSNNGKGTVSLLVKTKATEGLANGDIRMTFVRDMKPVKF